MTRLATSNGTQGGCPGSVFRPSSVPPTLLGMDDWASGGWSLGPPRSAGACVLFRNYPGPWVALDYHLVIRFPTIWQVMPLALLLREYKRYPMSFSIPMVTWLRAHFVQPLCPLLFLSLFSYCYSWSGSHQGQILAREPNQLKPICELFLHVLCSQGQPRCASYLTQLSYGDAFDKVWMFDTWITSSSDCFAAFGVDQTYGNIKEHFPLLRRSFWHLNWRYLKYVI